MSIYIYLYITNESIVVIWNDVIFIQINQGKNDTIESIKKKVCNQTRTQNQ